MDEVTPFFPESTPPSDDGEALPSDPCENCGDRHDRHSAADLGHCRSVLTSEKRTLPNENYRWLYEHQTEVLPKLVRDRMGHRIIADGFLPTLGRVAAEAFTTALIAKVGEEAAEVAATDNLVDAAEELGDLLAVVLDLARHLGVSWMDVEQAEADKRTERGGFQDGVMLLGFEPMAPSASGREDPDRG